METSFTESIENDTLGELNTLVEEEMETTAKFHNEHSIYLYCTLERCTANNIIYTNNYTAPLTLYETIAISRAMATNIKEPVTLRIALSLKLDKNEYYYDELTMQDKVIKERFKLRSIEDYKSKCVFTRCLIIEPQSKSKIIQYNVLKANKLFINPQYIV